MRRACMQGPPDADLPSAEPEGGAAAFEQAFFELQKWVDTSEDKTALLHAKRLARKGRLGAALKCAFNRLIKGGC